MPAQEGHGGRLEDLLRELAPQVLAALMRRYDDFGSAEDAVQEALLAAATQWPRDGQPEQPRAWLVQVGLRRMADQRRSEQSRRRREELIATEAPDDERQVLAADSAPEPERDDTLLLLFMCCHPALSQASSIALTLRAVGGLSTAEIAHAFMVPEATMAQRISRAKQSIRTSGVTFSGISERERDERLGAVLHVLYLIFNEGYTSSGGAELARSELSNEAIRLVRAVRMLLPQAGEVAGLLALMLLTDARRAARSGPGGELIPLPEQDRTLWDRAAIDEGVELVTETLTRGAVGTYVIQAAIQAVHDEAETAAATDWPQILALYGVLAPRSDNPMVTLNRAVAAAMVHGPGAGLTMLLPLDDDARIAGHHRLAAVRAHLLEMANERAQAISQYRKAASLTTSLPEQRYLISKAARLAQIVVADDALDE